MSNDPLALLIQFVAPIFTQRGKGTYLEKLEAEDRDAREIAKTAKWVVPDWLAQALDRIGIIGLVFLTTILLARGVGGTLASSQQEFLVTSTSPEMVVLRIYGDNLVCAPFNRSTGEVEQRFVVLKTAEDPDLMLALEEVGPLSSVEIIGSPTPSPTPTLLPTLTPSPTSTLTPTLTPLPKSPGD
ncbi:MAG: hypothetical protein KAW49_10775 [Anaerolineae bacterium]|nr:hypothetical protein [Anaerolineae bacterium]